MAYQYFKITAYANAWTFCFGQESELIINFALVYFIISFTVNLSIRDLDLLCDICLDKLD